MSIRTEGARLKVDPGRTLLIVEDSQDVRKIFLEAFQNEGYQVLEAQNGREAYDLMMSFGKLVNVVLTDLRMPVMDGLEFAALLKSDPRFSRIPVVLLSATPMKNSWKALDVFSALLVKPCSLSVLVRTVQSVQ